MLSELLGNEHIGTSYGSDIWQEIQVVQVSYCTPLRLLLASSSHQDLRLRLSRARVCVNTYCGSSEIMTSLNGSVKMSPYEKGDNLVESEGTAAIDGVEPGRAR